MTFPIRRTRKDKGHLPEHQRCHPGEILLFCPFDRLYLPFAVAEDDGRRECTRCRFRIADHELTDADTIRHIC